MGHVAWLGEDKETKQFGGNCAGILFCIIRAWVEDKIVSSLTNSGHEPILSFYLSRPPCCPVVGQAEKGVGDEDEDDDVQPQVPESSASKKGARKGNKKVSESLVDIYIYMCNYGQRMVQHLHRTS